MSENLNKVELVRLITSIVTSGDKSKAYVLKENTGNDTSFWNNYLISDFAISGLDILGIKHYQGNRREIKDLIDSEFKFE